MKLSPFGTARDRFAQLRGEAPVGDELARFARRIDVSRHDVDDEMVFVATELVRWQPGLSADDRRALALLLMSSMLSVRQGSTRLPLEGAPLRELAASILPGAGSGPLVERALAILRDGRAAELVGDGDDYLPLVVDGDYLYHQRMLAAERSLLDQLLERLEADAPVVDDRELTAAIAAVKKDSVIRLSAEQQRAVRAAITRPLAVITGGPGTGKTAIIVSILRVLARLGVSIESVALAAPTGKAAQRMRVSIADSLSRIAQPELFDRDLLAACPAPRTLHRLLGYSPRRDRFHHHENNRLAEQVVIVDEGSMIDLFMMERLLASVRSDARLILLGDADQLPSVEAGAVLRDLTPHAVKLTRSYRMDPSNPAGRAILTLAREINSGRAKALSQPARPQPISELVDQWYAQRVCGLADYERLAGKVYHYDVGAGRFSDDDERDLAALFEHFERSRILTVTRGLDTGSIALNRRLHAKVLASATVGQRLDFYPGEPVFMRENDYDRRLFNGDQGVIVRVADRDQRHHFRAVFPCPTPAPGERVAGAFRVFHLDAIRHQIELALAMTVHKSQGSEFDHVAVVLPDRDLPILTRELLYTAVTRARESVTVVGENAVMMRAVGRRTRRSSGFPDKLSALV
jgi:exodeoxyribonuclease V alpha subunit